MVLHESGIKSRPVDIKVRNFHIRLAETQEEIRASQRLRYAVFCEEMSAQPSDEMRRERREFDSYDDYCDHLLIFDLDRGDGEGEVVATYRFLRRAQAKAAGGFYSASEYDLSVFEAYPGEIMELGRSCVHRDYRSGPVMQLLWKGIASFIQHFDIALLFGCASLPGCDIEALKLPLAYLHHHHLAPPALRPKALDQHYVGLDLMPVEEIDKAAARQALPPLIKGYLRLGGYIGDGAYIDRNFGTTDVCIVVQTDLVSDRYRRNLTRGEASSGSEGAQ